jgi:sulfur-carrier protein adenylyltransferase/sulfurtransferase
LERYQAHINIPEIGVAGQKKISNAKILVVGAGGLGCPVLLYLVAFGIGTIGIIDNDIVDLGNIHRQIIYNEEDVGKYKVDIAFEKLKKTNSEVKILAFKERLIENNARVIIQDFDIVIDCSDNYTTRKTLDTICTELNKPWIYAAVGGFEGLVSVFNYKSGVKYKDLYTRQEEPAITESCSDMGILGSTCSYAASIEVTEAIKIILGLDSVLDGKVLAFNLLNHVSRLFAINSL